MNNGADAIGYYNSAKNTIFEYGFGTASIKSITFLLVNFLYLPMFAVFLVFNIFGAIGLLFFTHSLVFATRHKTAFIKKVAWMFIFLPSVSFWSSAIGKDSLAFLAASLALWAAIDLKRRIYSIVIAIAIMMLVRPHMAGLLVIAFCFSMIIESKVNLLKKLFFISLSSVISLIFIKITLNSINIQNGISIAALDEYTENRQSKNLMGGSSIDISNMSLPEQLFAYMFRPTILEINSIFSLAAAFDNLLLIFVFMLGIYHMYKSSGSKFAESRIFMWAYSLMAWLILAMTTANMGIALRQKWMFAPFLIFLMLSAMKQKRSRYLLSDSQNVVSRKKRKLLSL
jgi:hypothetical protein